MTPDTDTKTDEEQDELIQAVVSELKESDSFSGLLFQPHPQRLDGWKTTRPGALQAEQLAMTNKEVTPQFTRLALRYYNEGEEDENGYTYHSDTWIVETMDNGEYPWEEEDFHSREEAFERMAEIMVDVSLNRESADK